MRTLLITLNKVFISFATTILNIYCKSWRFTQHNLDENYRELLRQNIKPVFAMWHDQFLPCAYLHRNENVVAIASDSKDGDIVAYVFNRWKYNIVRGSTFKGGEKATLKAIKTTKEVGTTLAITVDGPIGPRHSVRSGAIFIAKKLDQVVIVATIKPKRFKKFNSWDRFILPLPFTKIDVYYSKPIYLSADTSKECIENDRYKLEKFMMDFTNETSPNLI